MIPEKFGIDFNIGGEEREVANTIKARYDAGVTNFKQDGTAVAIPISFADGQINEEIDTAHCLSAYGPAKKGIHTHQAMNRVVVPVLTPDRINKSQNGRRFKDNGEEAFTLTAQDHQGVGIEVPIREATKKGYAMAQEGDSINLTMPDSQTRRGRVGGGVAQTLDTSCNQGTIVTTKGNIPSEEKPGYVVEIYPGVFVWAVWYEKYQCYIAIRKLTPRECFRLQGWTDDYFEKAQFVNSDSQLYKQAGNGVTVNVVYEIAKRMEGEDGGKSEAEQFKRDDDSRADSAD